MRIIKNEMNVMFDCDDTLVMYHMAENPNAIDIKCPYTGDNMRLVPHKRHIEILKHQKARGFLVTVWSAAGWQWAKAIVEHLKLEDFVDEVRTKPLKVFDDMPVGEGIGPRVYIEYKE